MPVQRQQSLGRLTRIRSQGNLVGADGGARGSAKHTRRLALAVTALLALASLHYLIHRPQPKEYVLVVDAGSSGTRMYAYTWEEPGGASAAQGMPRLAVVPSSAAPHRVPAREKPDGRAYSRVETEPGLDRYASDAAELEAKALGPLLAWAEAVVPKAQWARTPVFLFGTAGLRRLAPPEQAAVLGGVRRALGRCHFRFEAPWARILTGEGVFGWIALNYAAGALRPGWAAAPPQGSTGGTGADAAAATPAEPPQTVGALDLGGSSLEVTFVAEPGGGEADRVTVTVLGRTHQLYVHMHSHYGLDDAFDRSVTVLLERIRPPDTAAGMPNGTEASAGGAAEEAAAGKPAADGGASTSKPAADGSQPLTLAIVDVAKQQQQLREQLKEQQQQVQQQQAQPEEQVHARRLADMAAAAAQPVPHPCLHSGYRQPYKRLVIGGLLPSPAAVELVGAPDWEACAALAEQVVNATAPCAAPPCRLGAPQPHPVGWFHALSGFHVVYHFYRLPPTASLGDLLKEAQRFCGTAWGDVHSARGAELSVDRYCFRGPYVNALLTKGLGLREDQVRIGSGEDGWTLGAALAEGNRLAGLGQPTVRISRRWLPAVPRPVAWLAALAAAAAFVVAAARRCRRGGGGGGGGGRLEGLAAAPASPFPGTKSIQDMRIEALSYQQQQPGSAGGGEPGSPLSRLLAPFTGGSRRQRRVPSYGALEAGNAPSASGSEDNVGLNWQQYGGAYAGRPGNRTHTYNRRLITLVDGVC